MVVNDNTKLFTLRRRVIRLYVQMSIGVKTGWGRQIRRTSLRRYVDNFVLSFTTMLLALFYWLLSLFLKGGIYCSDKYNNIHIGLQNCSIVTTNLQPYLDYLTWITVVLQDFSSEN